MDVSFSDSSQNYNDIFLDENIKKQDNTIIQQDIPVILSYISQLQNEGKSCKYIYDRLLENFHLSEINKHIEEIRELFGLEGLVGTIFINAKYLGCKKAAEFAKNSPYSNFIQGIIGCECGNLTKITLESNYNSIGNDFFASESRVENNKYLCNETNYIKLNSIYDIEKNKLNNVLKQLKCASFDNLDGIETESILEKVKNSFTAIMNPKRISKNNITNDDPEIIAASFNVDIEEPIKTKEKVGVEFRDTTVVAIAEKKHVDEDLDVSYERIENHIPLCKQVSAVEVQIDSSGEVDIDKEIKSAGKVKIDMKKSNATINAGNNYTDVAMKSKIKGNIQIDLNSKLKKVDVQMTSGSKISFENEKKSEKKLNIDAKTLVVLELEKEAKKQANLDISLYDDGITFDTNSESNVMDIETGKQELVFNESNNDNFFNDVQIDDSELQFDLLGEEQDFSPINIDVNVAEGDEFYTQESQKPFEFNNDEMGGLVF